MIVTKGFPHDLGCFYLAASHCLPSLNEEWLPLRLFRQGLELANLSMIIIVPMNAYLTLGFLHAGNMFDGANGLLIGSSFMWFVVMFDLQCS